MQSFFHRFLLCTVLQFLCLPWRCQLPGILIHFVSILGAVTSEPLHVKAFWPPCCYVAAICSTCFIKEFVHFFDLFELVRSGLWSFSHCQRSCCTVFGDLHLQVASHFLTVGTSVETVRPHGPWQTTVSLPNRGRCGCYWLLPIWCQTQWTRTGRAQSSANFKDVWHILAPKTDPETSQDIHETQCSKI